MELKGRLLGKGEISDQASFESQFGELKDHSLKVALKGLMILDPFDTCFDITFHE